MSLRLAIATALMVSAAPALAADLRDTHAEVSLPAGKTPGRYFVPLTAEECGATRHARPAGKIAMHPEGRAHCDTQIALADRAASAQNTALD